MASVRRSLFNNTERAKFLNQLVNGIKEILENPQVSNFTLCKFLKFVLCCMYFRLFDFFVKRIMPLIWNFCCGFKWTKGQQNSWVVVHFVLHLLNLTENRKWHFIVHIHVYQYFCTQQSVNKFVTMNNMRTYSIKLQLHAQTTFALSVRTKKNATRNVYWYWYW